MYWGLGKRCHILRYYIGNKGIHFSELCRANGEREVLSSNSCVSNHIVKLMGNLDKRVDDIQLEELVCPFGLIIIAQGWPVAQRTDATMPMAGRNVPHL
jgi:hypothetical protein